LDNKFAKKIVDFSRLCVHTITTKPWPIEEAIKYYAEQGVKGITVWRQALENRSTTEIGKLIRHNDLEIVSLCRGGFFPSLEDSRRRAAVKENIAAIEEAAELGAPLIVLVCGADPGQSLSESRIQIQEGIEAILPTAEKYGIRLAIEPLHPMYADNRSAINTLQQANNMCSKINSSYLGVTIDVYHLWWDADLENEIKRSGEMNKIYSFHLCDWRTPTRHMLYDRGLMGEGCIPINKIRTWVERAGFKGFNEVEIFSNRFWRMDQMRFLKKIKTAYLKYS
jgi:sugar phosphate isomerase/epimerase